MRVEKHRRSFACRCGKKRRLLAVPGRDTLLFNDLLGTTPGSSHGATFQGEAGSAFGEGGSDGLFFTGKPQIAGSCHMADVYYSCFRMGYGNSYDKQTNSSLVSELSSGIATFSSVGGVVAVCTGAGAVIALTLEGLSTLAGLISYLNQDPLSEYWMLLQQDVLLSKTRMSSGFVGRRHVGNLVYE
jgi:hypothetical protein